MTGSLRPETVLLRMLMWGWGAVALVSLGGILWAGPPSGLGLLSGGGVTLLSVGWLGATGVRLSPERMTSWKWFMLGTIVRYLVLIAVLVVLVRSPWVSLPALALGLAVPLPIIAWRGIRMASQVAG